VQDKQLEDMGGAGLTVRRYGRCRINS